jgi:hypothetical protein
MIRPRIAVRLMAVLVAIGVVPIHAQQPTRTTRGSRAFDRLFVQDDQARPGSLTVSGYEGRDTAREELPVLGQAPVQSGGLFTGLSASAALTKYGRSSGFLFESGGAMRRYSATGQSTMFGHATGEMRYGGRRLGVRTRVLAAYAPYYQFLPVMNSATSTVEDADRRAQDLAVSDRTVTTLSSVTDLGRQLTRDTMLSGAYTLRFTHYGSMSGIPQRLNDVLGHEGMVRVSHQLGKYTSFFGGYGLRYSPRPSIAGEALKTHDIDVGVDRAQQLRLARRSTFSFRTGSSIVEVREGHRFIFTGSGMLQHALSRYWTTSLEGRRAVLYVEGLTEPVLVDGVTGTVQGPIGSHFDFMAWGGYSKGDIGLSAQTVSSTYRVLSGTTRLRAMLTTRLGVYAEWTQYRQQNDQGPGLPEALAQVFHRQGWRTGLILQMPIQSQKTERGAR